jgi:hypothetical protein
VSAAPALSRDRTAVTITDVRETVVHVFFPFNGFADDCPVVDGHVGLPDSPGIGSERKAELYKVMKALAG